MSKTKAQEEIVGFIMVVVLVAVIFLVFLGFTIRSDSEISTSSEVSHFLDSISEFTTSCSLDGGFSYKQLDDLAISCDRGQLCSNGNACNIFESTLKNLTESAWNFSPNSPEKSYVLTTTFPAREPIIISSENQSACNTIRGADKIFSGITLALEICLD